MSVPKKYNSSDSGLRAPFDKGFCTECPVLNCWSGIEQNQVSVCNMDLP